MDIQALDKWGGRAEYTTSMASSTNADLEKCAERCLRIVKQAFSCMNFAIGCCRSQPPVTTISSGSNANATGQSKVCI